MPAKPQSKRELDPRIVGFLLWIGSLALFADRIDRPLTIYFDETHYVPAARALIARSGPINVEHPLFAKTMIAAGMMVFGDNSLGWRLPSAFFAAVCVVALFWVGRMVFRANRPALLAALLLLCNQTLFIQARIAMLEMPMTAFLLLAAGCLLKARDVGAGKRRWEYAGAVALGLAVGSKWLAIPYAALFMATLAWAKYRDGERDLGGIVDRIIPDLFKLSLAAMATYLATFWPAFLYTHEPMTLGQLIPFQFRMLHIQQAPLALHPYRSQWWQWPLMLRPIWYLFAKTGGHYEAVLLIGNPIVYWGGLALVVISLGGWHKLTSPALKAALLVYLFSLVIWVLIPKQVEFFYYYNLSAIILCFVIAAFCETFGPRGIRVLGWITALSAASFVYFYPIISGQPLPADDTWTSWVWMKSWY